MLKMFELFKTFVGFFCSALPSCSGYFLHRIHDKCTHQLSQRENCVYRSLESDLLVVLQLVVFFFFKERRSGVKEPVDPEEGQCCGSESVNTAFKDTKS